MRRLLIASVLALAACGTEELDSDGLDASDGSGGSDSGDADVPPADIADDAHESTDADDAETMGDTSADVVDADVDVADTVDVADDADAIDAIDAADATDGDTADDTIDEEIVEVPLWEVDVCALTEPSTRTADAWIAIGTSTREGAYSPLGEPAQMTIGQGFQGGYHLWGGYEAEGMPTTNDSHWCVVDTTTETTVGSAYLTNALVALGDHQVTSGSEGLTVFLDYSITDPTVLTGHALRVCVAAKSVEGEIVSDCRVVDPVCCDYIGGI